MRDKFISGVNSIKEKEFWMLFFREIDKRTFVDDEFQVRDFGCRINNKYLKLGTKNYSLMYTRNGLFKMNNMGLNGKKWNGLNRLKNWCDTPNLPEQFYNQLNNKKLLSETIKGEFIDIPLLLKSQSSSQLVSELFDCIDLFK